MAIQKNGSKLSGKVGNKVYANQNGQTVVKELSKKKHELSEASVRSGNDLAEASKHSKKVRTAFADMVEEYGDNGLHYRLNARFYDVIRPLPKIKQGEKKVQDGDFSQLLNFQFNKHCRLDSLLFKIPKVDIDLKGALVIDFRADKNEGARAVATGFNQVMLQLSILKYDFRTEYSSLMTMGNLVGRTLPSAKKKLELDLNGDLLLIVVTGIQYLVDGARSYSREKQAAAITHVFRLRDGQPVVFKSVVEAVEEKVTEKNVIAWDE